MASEEGSVGGGDSGLRWAVLWVSLKPGHRFPPSRVPFQAECGDLDGRPHLQLEGGGGRKRGVQRRGHDAWPGCAGPMAMGRGLPTELGSRRDCLPAHVPLVAPPLGASRKFRKVMGPAGLGLTPCALPPPLSDGASEPRG